MLSLCFKMSFQNEKQQKGKVAFLTTTLSAERTLHATGKNYAVKTIPAGKILERNLLNHYKRSSLVF